MDVSGLSVFDLDAFMGMVQRNSKWQCPHTMKNSCYKVAGPPALPGPRLSPSLPCLPFLLWPFFSILFPVGWAK